MDTVQETILKLRATGLSQSEIARELDIPQPRISRWERGDAPDSADDALKLRYLLERITAINSKVEGEEVPAQPPSIPRPLLMSGQGAKPVCQTEGPGSIDEPEMIADIAHQGAAMKTAADELNRGV